MLLLDALYINNSGGKVLLDEVIRKLLASGEKVFFVLDERCLNEYSEIPDKKRIFLSPTIKSRESFYKKNFPEEVTTVLCFANIPPPIKLSCCVYTYFHNMNLLKIPSSTSIYPKIKLFLKRLYVYQNRKNSDFFIVQSEIVKELLVKKRLIDPDKVLIYPFFKSVKKGGRVKKVYRDKSGFVYVSNGNPHKNHDTLLDAWVLLYKKGLTPKLHLTVTLPYSQLLCRIEKLKDEGIPIYNHGWSDPTELYSANYFCIYPSLSESLGLGLIESVQSGCNVLAADLPYVTAVIKPTDTFNPYSATDIATTVIKYLKDPAVGQPSTILIEDRLEELIQLIISQK